MQRMLIAAAAAWGVASMAAAASADTLVRKRPTVAILILTGRL